MSNVIQFLESMGGNAVMARMTAADYEATVAMLDVEAASREALRFRDYKKLNGLLKGRPIMMCNVASPDEKQPDQEEVPSESEGEEKSGQVA